MTVLVGGQEPQQRFHLHKDLLCNVSEFFSAALTGNFKEAEDGKITLPEQNPETFKYFVHWLYTGSLKGFYYPRTIEPTIWDLSTAVDKELERLNLSMPDELPHDNLHRLAMELASYRDAPFTSLIALYILADALQVRHLKDLIISTLVNVYGHQYSDAHEKSGYNLYWTSTRPEGLTRPATGINMAYQMLPTNSHLCQLLVRLFCDSTTDIAYHHAEEPLHPAFLIAVGSEFADRWMADDSTTDWTKTATICEYHEHEGKSCALTAIYLGVGVFSNLD